MNNQTRISEEQTAQNLQFMRSAMEKTYRQVTPKTSNSIMWGLIAMSIYVGIHFMVKNQLCHWIRPFQLSLIAVGVICTIIQGYFLFKQFRQQGFIPQLMITLFYGLVIIALPVLLFDLAGLFKGMYCGSAFIYALTLNTILVLVGICHSKLWFIGTFFIIAGMLTAFVIKEYSLLILGIATGTGIILSALLVDIHHRKMEKENA